MVCQIFDNILVFAVPEKREKAEVILDPGWSPAESYLQFSVPSVMWAYSNGIFIGNLQAAQSLILTRCKNPQELYPFHGYIIRSFLASQSFSRLQVKVMADCPGYNSLFCNNKKRYKKDNHI